MGWSCTAEADKTFRNIMDSSFGGSNFRREGDLLFSFEVGREQPDGSITGIVEKAQLAYMKEGREYFNTLKKSSLKIAPNGEIVKFPKWALKGGAL